MIATERLQAAAKAGLVGLLGSGPVSSAVRTMKHRNLRVLAYHDVSDGDRFAAHLDHLQAEYHPVSGTEVASAVRGGASLPDRSVWITFDDGHAKVVEIALPLLGARGVPATMFVSPGLVATGSAPWWVVIEQATESGWQFGESEPSGVVARLKRVADRERRNVVESAQRHLELVGAVPSGVLADRAALRRWLDDGMELGNHTWDHPCLDRCDGEEQRRQISAAHDWLADFGAFDTSTLFAYPNGDWTPESERTLDELGYDVGLLFDHRVNPPGLSYPLRLSRLRIDATAPISRARAIMSGAHSLAYRPDVAVPE